MPKTLPVITRDFSETQNTVLDLFGFDIKEPNLALNQLIANHSGTLKVLSINGNFLTKNSADILFLALKNNRNLQLKYLALNSNSFVSHNFDLLINLLESLPNQHFPEFLDLSTNFFGKLDNDKLFKLILALSNKPKLRHLDFSDNGLTNLQINYIKNKLTDMCPTAQVNFDFGSHIMPLFLDENAEIQQRLNEANEIAVRRAAIKLYLENVYKLFRSASFSLEECLDKIRHFIAEINQSYPEIYASEEYIPQLRKIADEASVHLEGNKNTIFNTIFEKVPAQHLAKSDEFQYLANFNLIENGKINEAFVLLLEKGDIESISYCLFYLKGNIKKGLFEYCNDKDTNILIKLFEFETAFENERSNGILNIIQHVVPYLNSVYLYKNNPRIETDYLSENQKAAMIAMAIANKKSDLFALYWDSLSVEQIEKLLEDDSLLQSLDSFENMLTNHLKESIKKAFQNTHLFTVFAQKGLFKLYGSRITNIVKEQLSSTEGCRSIYQTLLNNDFVKNPSWALAKPRFLEYEAIKPLIKLVYESGDFYTLPHSGKSFASRLITMSEDAYLPEFNDEQIKECFIKGIETHSLTLLNFAISKIKPHQIHDFLMSSYDVNKNILYKLLELSNGPELLASLNVSPGIRSTINALLVQQHVEKINRKIINDQDPLLLALTWMSGAKKHSNHQDSLLTIPLNKDYFNDFDTWLVKIAMNSLSHRGKSVMCDFVSYPGLIPKVSQENSTIELEECKPEKTAIIMSLLNKEAKALVKNKERRPFIFLGFVEKLAQQYPSFFHSPDTLNGLMGIFALFSLHKRYPLISHLIKNLSIEDRCKYFSDIPTQAFSEEDLEAIFNRLIEKNIKNAHFFLENKFLPKGFLIGKSAVFVSENDKFLFYNYWKTLSLQEKTALLNQEAYSDTRALVNFNKLVLSAMEQNIIDHSIYLLDSAFFNQLYEINAELFNEATTNILNNSHKDILLYYFGHSLASNNASESINKALECTLKKIVDTDLLFDRFKKENLASPMILNDKSQCRNLFELMLAKHKHFLMRKYKHNDKLLQKMFLEVFECSSESLRDFILLIEDHKGKDELINLLLSKTVDRSNDSCTLAECILSISTKDSIRKLSYLKRHFAGCNELMMILIARLSNVLSSKYKTDDQSLIFFYIDIINSISREDAIKYIDKLYESLPSNNMDIILRLCSFCCSSFPNFPLLLEVLLTKIENEKLTELINTDLISYKILMDRNFKNIIIQKADKNLFKALLGKHLNNQWAYNTIVDEVLKLDNAKKAALLEILLLNPLMQGFTLSRIAECHTETLFMAKDIIGTDQFIVLLQGKITSRGRYSAQELQTISKVLQLTLEELKPDNPEYKRFIHYVRAYAHIYSQKSLTEQVENIEKNALLAQLPTLALGPDGVRFNVTLKELMAYIQLHDDIELFTEVVNTIMSNLANNKPEILNVLREVCAALGNSANMHKEKLIQFELFSKSVEELRKAHPSKVKGKKVELPLAVAQALIFDKILKYLIKKYEEVKGSEPKKPGQKTDAKWVKYQTRLNHYAKFHDALVKASMQQPASTDLGAELGKILKDNPLPKTNAIFTSDRYGQLVQLLITTPTPVLLLRFKEMADKLASLYNAGNPPHPVKQLVSALAALRLFQTDQLNQQQYVLDEENNSHESDNIIISPKADNNLSKYGNILFMPSIEDNPNTAAKEKKKLEKERKLQEKKIFTDEYLQSPYIPPMQPSAPNDRNRNMRDLVKEQEELYIDDQDKDNEEQNKQEEKPTIRFEL